ncbi:hypothetical protein C8J57DRAFT_155960 [Mycena rebaudengoi]|nr:hypothetical protein C8J57DRAFT_155960 [Mycena rebaudengoi]
MLSLLEQVPGDVLQHIAFLGAASCAEPPTDLCSLLATSRAIYDTLNIRSSPQLYAAIYEHTYDDSTTRTTNRSLTASSLAHELVQRCRALRRCRHLDVSPLALRQDLWTMLWMLEGKVNTRILSEAGLCRFSLVLAQHYLEDQASALLPNSRDEVKHLILWLLCLTLSREDILSQSPEARNRTHLLLRPFASATSTLALTSSPAGIFRSAPTDNIICRPSRRSAPLHVNPDEELMRYSRICRPYPPLVTDSAAAIILTFAFKETEPPQIPPHLPGTRAIAAAMSRSGPTMDDPFFVQRSVLLFADVRLTMPTSTPALDPQTSLLLGLPGNLELCPMYPAYAPGAFTGIWEGSLMVSSCVSLDATPSSAPPDFLCRAPMQCVFSEYFCFSPGAPLDMGDSKNLLPSGKLFPHSINDSEETGGVVSAESFSYEKLNPGSQYGHEITNDALDHILIGKTLEAHDAAWGRI